MWATSGPVGGKQLCNEGKQKPAAAAAVGSAQDS